jgi:BirA family transcriptional regulator, biotin operon repressor / biotin---[acetyl-CoA-carboxylase] ligase
LSADASDWPDAYARHVLAEVGSTNSEAARLAPGLTRPAWIMARRQTGGRGRRGRAWVSPEGNFFASLVMRSPGDPAQAALRSFVAALALDDALGALVGPAGRFTLKWPNDVLLNGGKVAGILLESGGQGPQLNHLIIGIGVNLIAAPPAAAVEPDALKPVSVLGETGLRFTPDELLDRLGPAFARWESQFTAYGFAPIRTAWLARAARLGQTIRARTMGETYEGRFEGLAEDGALVLGTDQGRRTISAADIFF